MFFWTEIDLKYEFNKWVFPLGLLTIMAALMYITFTAKIAYKTKDGSDVGEALKDMRRSTWKNMEPWLIGLGVIFGWIGIGVALLYIGYRIDEGGWSRLAACCGSRWGGCCSGAVGDFNSGVLLGGRC